MPKFSDVKSSAASSNDTLTVTGAYRYFIGCYSDLPFDNKVYSSTSVRNMSKDGGDCVYSGFIGSTVNINQKITVPVGTKGMYIAIPAGIDDAGNKLVVVQNSFSNTEVQGDIKPTKRVLEKMACAGSATKDYVIFTWSAPSGTKGEETFTITIK